MQLSRDLGVKYDTAWRMKHKLMQVMLERNRKGVLGERIEIDDAYLGGEMPGKRKKTFSNPDLSLVPPGLCGHIISTLPQPPVLPKNQTTSQVNAPGKAALASKSTLLAGTSRPRVERKEVTTTTSNAKNTSKVLPTVK